jgi:hypothetical protein
MEGCHNIRYATNLRLCEFEHSMVMLDEKDYSQQSSPKDMQGYILLLPQFHSYEDADYLVDHPIRVSFYTRERLNGYLLRRHSESEVRRVKRSTAIASTGIFTGSETRKTT